LEFRQIRYALSVAKERSFTRASASLNISQSAVSEQIKLLEAEIGFKLFQRTPRGIDLTDSGRAFMQDAERVVADVLSLSDTARLLRSGSPENLTLGMVSGTAQIFMPALFRQFDDLLHGIRVRILTAPTKNIFSDLHEGRIDAGIAIEADPDRVPAGLVFQRLAAEEMVAISTPCMAWGKGDAPSRLQHSQPNPS
jgi:DNA-binding transcriptional LysR family regulator